MKIETKIKKYQQSYPIGSSLMYDCFGKNDFRKFEVEKIVISNEIKCFKFKHVTGYWPIEKRLIKQIDLPGTMVIGLRGKLVKCDGLTWY